MNQFIIESENGLVLTFHSRAFTDDGWLGLYKVTATGPNFSALVDVDNAPQGSSPVEFFSRLASDWKGWEGEKSWGSLEGEFALRAISDSKGHITLSAEFQPCSLPPCWFGSISLLIESGQTEILLKHARQFFNELA